MPQKANRHAIIDEVRSRTHEGRLPVVILQRLESFPGLVVLASNRKQDLDPAFLRRLRHIVHLPPSFS